jgi:hypothetical protein
MEPDKFFIVPYRDRSYQLEIFINHMSKLMEGENYQILIIHQKDSRLFNRGAMKNIGFLYIKEKYPHSYKDKIIIFHDIDVLIAKKENTDFNTTKNIVKHNFGFKPTKTVKALGGIVTIRADDFEKTNGFLNLWTWGLEDNALLKRCMRKKINIDYSSFNEIRCKEVIMFNTVNKTRKTNNDYSFKNFNDNTDKNYGFQTIKNLNYSFENIRENAYFVNVNNFNTVGKYPNKTKEEIILTFQDPKIRENNKKYGHLIKLF